MAQNLRLLLTREIFPASATHFNVPLKILNQMSQILPKFNWLIIPFYMMTDS